MARPTIYDTPMTPAERMRRYRDRKRNPPPRAETHAEALRQALTTKRKLADYVNRSERWVYYLGVYGRERLIDWDGDVVNGRYGKIGMEFLAEVCRYGDAEAQQKVHDRIKASGAAAGRALWQEMIQGHEELIRKHEHRREYREFLRYWDLSSLREAWR